MDAMFRTAFFKYSFIRPGCTLAALFGWLLSFPMFGRLLMDTAGEKGVALGLTFVFSHALGLLLLHMLPAKLAAASLPVKTAGGLVAFLTLVFTFLHGVFMVDLLIFILLGLVTAYLVLAWVSWFALQDRPLEVLVIAMTGANVVFAAVNVPVLAPGRPGLVLLAALALAGVLAFQPVGGEQGAEGKVPRKGCPSGGVLKALAAFAVATYFVGGIWYHSFPLYLASEPYWELTIGALIYIGGIIFLARLARRGQPGELAPFSLSALGLGLLIALTDSDNTLIVLSYHTAFKLGLAAADLFFWYALWALGKFYGSRRIFGLGLGFSLLLIASSIILRLSGWFYASPALLFLSALALLFMAVPLITRHPFQLVNLLAAEKETPVICGTLTPPGILTPTENKVYLLLMQGAGDSEIAEKMYISRHTAKFHVRNILLKLKAKNRKELLSRGITRQDNDRSG